MVQQFNIPYHYNKVNYYMLDVGFHEWFSTKKKYKLEKVDT